MNRVVVSGISISLEKLDIGGVSASRTYHKEFLLINALISVRIKHVERNIEPRLRLYNVMFTTSVHKLQTLK